MILQVKSASRSRHSSQYNNHAKTPPSLRPISTSFKPVHRIENHFPETDRTIEICSSKSWKNLSKNIERKKENEEKKKLTSQSENIISFLGILTDPLYIYICACNLVRGIGIIKRRRGNCRIGQRLGQQRRGRGRIIWQGKCQLTRNQWGFKGSIDNGKDGFRARMFRTRATFRFFMAVR